MFKNEKQLVRGLVQYLARTGKSDWKVKCEVDAGVGIADVVLYQTKSDSAQAQAGNYDTNPDKLTEMDALVSYLQLLGTMVDFRKYDDDYFAKFR